MTASSTRQMIINSRERAVSSDINRLQAFIGAQTAQTAHAGNLTKVFTGSAGGDATSSDSIMSPLLAEIVSGMMARPQIASTALVIDPGVAYVVFPDASPNPDDAPTKVVIDPGRLAADAPTLTPGDPAQFRIDILECQPQSVVTESSSRDIYDPTSGLFTPQVVNKVTQLQMLYNIRLGTPGAGFPGTIAGWLPLMVAVIAPAATTWDQVMCWDVRPLVSDAPSSPKLSRAHCAILRSQINCIARIMDGNDYVEADFDGRIAGGTQPFSTADIGPLAAGANQRFDPSLLTAMTGVGPATPWIYWYALFPFGLPRWCRYQSAPTARTPGPFRGIPVFTSAVPTTNNRPGAAITLPAGLGFGAAVAFEGVRVCHFYTVGTAIQNFAMDGDRVKHTVPSIFMLVASTPGNSANTHWDLSMNDNTVVPASCRRVRLSAFGTFGTQASPGAPHVENYSVIMSNLSSPAAPDPISIKYYTAYFGLVGGGEFAAVGVDEWFRPASSGTTTVRIAAQTTNLTKWLGGDQGNYSIPESHI